MKPFRYSTINLYHKCPKYYELNQILGIPDDAEQSADMAFGTAIHAAIQAIFEGYSGSGLFQDLWGEQRKREDLNYTRYKWEDLNVIGEELITRFHDYKKHFVPAHLEQKLIAPLGNHLISGTVDFIGMYKGIPSVVDWKTSAMPYDAYKIRCNEQMYGYDYLARTALGFQAEQKVYGVAIKDLKNPRWQFRVAPLTEENRAKMMSNLEQMCETIANTKTFHRNPNSCVAYKRVCPYFEHCFGEKILDKTVSVGHTELGNGEANRQDNVCESVVETRELSLARNGGSHDESEGI